MLNSHLNQKKTLGEWIMSKFTEMLEMVSRTFALSIRYLPKALQEPVSLSYLLFRVSDGL